MLHSAPEPIERMSRGCMTRVDEPNIGREPKNRRAMFELIGLRPQSEGRAQESALPQQQMHGGARYMRIDMRDACITPNAMCSMIVLRSPT